MYHDENSGRFLLIGECMSASIDNPVCVQELFTVEDTTARKATLQRKKESGTRSVTIFPGSSELLSSSMKQFVSEHRKMKSSYYLCMQGEHYHT